MKNVHFIWGQMQKQQKQEQQQKQHLSFRC